MVQPKAGDCKQKGVMTMHQEKSHLLNLLNELDFHLVCLDFWTLFDSRTSKTTKTTKMQLAGIPPSRRLGDCTAEQ
jgi:hypothetical protein